MQHVTIIEDNRIVGVTYGTVTVNENAVDIRQTHISKKIAQMQNNKIIMRTHHRTKKR